MNCPKGKDSSVLCTAACCRKSIGEVLEEECVHEYLSQLTIWIFNATIPSEHKSAFIESSAPGTTFKNHLGQGLEAAEATLNVT